MDITAICPTCGARYRVPESNNGKTAACKKCGLRFTIDGIRDERRQESHPAQSLYEPEERKGEPPSDTADEKLCPFCGETIKRIAIKCKHCGSDLMARPQPAHAASFARAPVGDVSQPERPLFHGSVSQMTHLGAYILLGCMSLVGIVGPFLELPLGAGLGIIAACGLFAFVFYIDAKYTKYHVTTERIEVEKGWISKRMDNLDLFRLKDVRLQIGILDRVLGLGNVVTVSTDKSDPVLMLRGLDGAAARRLYEDLKKEAVRADRRRGVVHIEA